MKLLIVRFDLEGSHYWSEAPLEYRILSNLHGHIFHFEIKIEVEDSNREVEFLHFRSETINAINYTFGHPLSLESRSCEMIADEVKKLISPDIRVHSIQVMEDQFVGAEVIYESRTD